MIWLIDFLSVFKYWFFIYICYLSHSFDWCFVYIVCKWVYVWTSCDSFTSCTKFGCVKETRNGSYSWTTLSLSKCCFASLRVVGASRVPSWFEREGVVWGSAPGPLRTTVLKSWVTVKGFTCLFDLVFLLSFCFDFFVVPIKFVSFYTVREEFKVSILDLSAGVFPLCEL